mmetsp:Transcript_21982/g.61489  ORF Transcript_21982/g.61489 Transcript_21982/m.61489 type:complete len:206 (+) Transcript_21982:391-1008(+)
MCGICRVDRRCEGSWTRRRLRWGRTRLGSKAVMAAPRPPRGRFCRRRPSRVCMSQCASSWRSCRRRCSRRTPMGGRRCTSPAKAATRTLHSSSSRGAVRMWMPGMLMVRRPCCSQQGRAISEPPRPLCASAPTSRRPTKLGGHRSWRPRLLPMESLQSGLKSTRRSAASCPTAAAKSAMSKASAPNCPPTSSHRSWCSPRLASAQ